jgi:hypothetical protein
MDQRLFRIHGLRPHRLTKHDLPSLAKAMVAYMRKEATLEKYFVQNVACIHFSGVGINVLVRSDDWVKVLPYLKDGTFDAIVTPVPKVRMRVPLSEANMADVYGSDMYYRILHTLDPLFPVDFP